MGCRLTVPTPSPWAMPYPIRARNTTMMAIWIKMMTPLRLATRSMPRRLMRVISAVMAQMKIQGSMPGNRAVR